MSLAEVNAVKKQQRDVTSEKLQLESQVAMVGALMDGGDSESSERTLHPVI